MWAAGERHAEGVLVGEFDGESWVCFDDEPSRTRTSFRDLLRNAAVLP